MKIHKTGIDFYSSDDCSSKSWIFLFFRNSAVVSFGKNQCVFQKNSVLICKENVIQKIRPFDSEKLKFDWIRFEMNSSDEEYLGNLSVPYGDEILVGNNKSIYNVIQILHSEISNNSDVSDDFSLYVMNMLFLLVNRRIVERQNLSETPTPYYKKLLKIRKSIYAEPSHNWNVDEICAEMKISKTYFHRLYFLAFGVTCMQDVIAGRIELAKELLMNTDFSVNVIAEKCGYESDSYFMRQFKKCTGITPTSYRKNFSDVE